MKIQLIFEEESNKIHKKITKAHLRCSLFVNKIYCIQCTFFESLFFAKTGLRYLPLFGTILIWRLVNFLSTLFQRVTPTNLGGYKVTNVFSVSNFIISVTAKSCFNFVFLLNCVALLAFLWYYIEQDILDYFSQVC